MKRPKKAIIKTEKVSYTKQSVTCPHCHTNMSGIPPQYYILMFECWRCRNPIDLRDKDGKRSYAETANILEDLK